MKQLFVSLFLFILTTYYLILNTILPPSAEAALAPLFEPGGQLCSRTSSYQDRSNPACYVTQAGSSTYNLYVPTSASPRRGQDPNVSQTCFVVNRAKTETRGPAYTPGYEIVKHSHPPLTFISTLETEWPWDIPQEEDYPQLTLNGKLKQYIADTFALQGTQRIPTQILPQIIVDQHGPLEKLQPLLFQVKDRLDYCQLLDQKRIFDEPVNFTFANQDKTLLLSQICSSIPFDLEHVDNLPQALSQWHHDAPELAEAFYHITPYIQNEQVAWMVIYMYQYDYNPIDGPRTIVPQPTDKAVIKLNIAGLSRYTQAEQRLNDALIPQDLQSDTPIPQGFRITSSAQFAQLENQIFQIMKELGYEEEPQPCDLPVLDGEFEPGPPLTQQTNLLTTIKQFFLNLLRQGNPPGFDAELDTVYVGRCTPQDWTKTFDAAGNHTGWECTAQTPALANVYLLNPTYLKNTCDDFYLAPAGYLKAHFPQDLITQGFSQPLTDVPPPTPKPLLPYFHVLEANYDPSPVSSPNRPSDPEGRVDLPTACQAETARAQSLAFLGKALRPQEFRNQPPQNIFLIYQPKVSGFFSNLLNSFFTNVQKLFPFP